MTLTRGIVLQLENSIDVEPDALTLYDLSRYRNNGTMVGAGQPNAVRLPSGLWVWDFDGIDDFISIPYSDSLNLTENLILETWVYIKADENGGLIQKNYATGYMLWMENLASGFRLFVNNAVQASSLGAIALNTWYHLVGVVDGVANQLYQNGVPQTSMAAATPTGNANVVLIGEDNANRHPNWMGGFFGIYNYCLTPGQIRNNYETNKHWFGVND